MILGAEIGLLVCGLYALIVGKFSIGRNRAVIGGPARVLGLICLLPLPIAFGAGLVLGLFYTFVLSATIPILISTVTEVVIILVILIVVSLLGKKFYNDQDNVGIDQFE